MNRKSERRKEYKKLSRMIWQDMDGLSQLSVQVQLHFLWTQLFNRQIILIINENRLYFKGEVYIGQRRKLNFQDKES